MSKKFKTNVTYATIFKKFLEKGEKNTRIIITGIQSSSDSVFLGFMEAIKASSIFADKAIDSLELKFFANDSINIITSVKIENYFIAKLYDALKPLLNNAVALKANIYRKGTKLSWLVINGAAYKSKETGKKYIDYDSYYDILDRVLKCHSSKNIKCTILDQFISQEEKHEYFEQLITAGILNQDVKYSNVKLTYIKSDCKKQLQTRSLAYTTGNNIKEMISEVFSKDDIYFAYLSLVTTKKKLLEWAICY